MAWSWIGTSSPVYVANGNITLTEPSGVAENDLLIAAVVSRGPAVFTLPSGWTLLGTAIDGNALSGANAATGLRFAYIKRGASAPSLTFTRTSGVTAIGAISAYRASSGDFSLVIAATAGLAVGTTKLTVDAPSGMTATGDLFVGVSGPAMNEYNTGYPYAEYGPLTRSLDNTNASLALSDSIAVQRTKYAYNGTYPASMALFDGKEPSPGGLAPTVDYWPTAGARHSGGLAIFREVGAPPGPTNNSSFFSFF